MKSQTLKTIFVLSLLSIPAFAESQALECDSGQKQVMSCDPSVSDKNDPEQAKSLGPITVCQVGDSDEYVLRSENNETGAKEDITLTKIGAIGATTYKGEFQGLEVKIVRKVIAPTHKINGSITMAFPDGMLPELTQSLELACK
jgi:hypothetical protein